jgi:hypothetical protein
MNEISDEIGLIFLRVHEVNIYGYKVRNYFFLRLCIVWLFSPFIAEGKNIFL